MSLYTFGSFRYDAAARRLLRRGSEVGLTPKLHDLLLLFLEQPGRVLTRDEIAARLWPDVIVTDAALSFQIADLRRALGDAVELLQTVPKVGYRWTGGSRRAWSADGEPPAVHSPVRAAVFPLAVIGLADDSVGVGLADSIATRLSLLPGITVAGTSAVLEAFRRGDGNLAASGCALGADVVTEGSVRSDGSMLEVRLRVVRVPSGLTVWAGSARAVAGDRLSVEERLGYEVGRALHVPLEQLAIERWTAPTSIDAAELYWRAQALALRGWTASREAMRLLGRALELDPRFAAARTLRASLLGLEVGYGMASDPVRSHDEALREATEAVRLEPENPYARSVLGGAMADVGLLDEGAEEAFRAREAAPSRPSIHMLVGWLYRWAGLLDRAERAYGTAFRIDPSLWRAGVHLAYVKTLLGSHEEAQGILDQLSVHGATAETAALEMSAWRAYGLGDRDAAEQLLRAVASREPVLNYGERLRALLAACRGDREPAERLLARPGDADYPDGRRRFDRAGLFVAAGDADGAIRELLAAERYGFQTPQAVRFDPDLSRLAVDPRLVEVRARWEEVRRRREATWR